MKYTVLIFDQDGTIADTLPLIAQAVINSYKSLTNKLLTQNEVMATFGISEEGIMNRLFPAMPEEAFKTYLEQYEQLHDSICPAPFSGIRELMSALVEKGFHLAMVTGKSRQATDITLKKFGLLPFFELIETGSPEKASKVNKLTNVLHHFNINPSEALYIGDEARDIDYCRKANIAIASAAWASTAQLLELEQQNPGMVFKQLESFKDWLFKQ